MARRLPGEALRAVCDPGTLPFSSTADLAPLDGMIGQDRAVNATAFGVGMRDQGYNLFALGPARTGKTSVMKRVIARTAEAEPTPSDHCYVHNFERGEIQAVGGINEKIEGFFDVCRERGLTGRQGVLIPEANARHLMLREDVVQAVRAEQFHVHAISTVDEGLALLTGRDAGERGPDGRFPEGSFNAAVEQALEANVKRLRALRADPARPAFSADRGALRSGDAG
jgi:hypothetical protein